MKIKLKFKMNNEKIPMAYNSFILSFIKKSLKEYDEKIYNTYYNENDPIIKTFTFAIFLNNPIFLKDEIIVKSKEFELNLSDYDETSSLNLYNSFKGQLNQDFKIKENIICLTNVLGKFEKPIIQESIIVKMLSPLIVREHNPINNKDLYYTFEDADFSNKLKINIENLITKLKINVPTNNFEIKPLKARKTVVKSFNSRMNASIGVFQLNGNIDLINFLIKAGIGSKRSAGYGYFKIIA